MTLPNRFTSDLLAVNLISDATHRYAAMYTLDGELLVAKSPIGGAWTSTRLAEPWRTTLGLPVANDDHNYPAIAIDGAGFLHLWANMHNDPLRYLVSASPRDIYTWVPATLPGWGPEGSYPIPIQRPDGTLRFYARDGAAVTSGAGRCDSHIWDFGSGTSAGAPTTIFQGLLVPDAAGPGVPGVGPATDTDLNWSAYLAIPVVTGDEASWVEHWAFIWRRSGTAGRSNTLPSYMQFRSATNTWHAADGTAVTLPITPLNNASVRTGMAAGAEGYLNFGGLAIDAAGHPHMVISMGPTYHIYWTGSQWRQEALLRSLDGCLPVGRLSCYWLHGALWVLGVDSTRARPILWRMAGTGSDCSLALGGEVQLTSPWECAADPEAYRRHGAVEVLIPDGNDPMVFAFGNGARRRSSTIAA